MAENNIILTIKKTIEEFESIKRRGIKVEFHPKGETANGDVDLQNFINASNLKYFNVKSDELLDDFLNLVTPESSDKKTSFIRLQGSYIKELTNDELEEFVNKSLDYASRVEGSASDIVNKMMNYNDIKNDLIIRPLNYKNNKNNLEDFVYLTHGDIALTLYAVVLDDEDNNCLNTVKVPKTIADSWNLDYKDVLLAALLNTKEFAPPRIYTNILNIENTSDDEAAFMKSGYSEKLEKRCIPLVTTTRKTNGAISLFYPGVKEKIAEMFDNDFYVGFTSIHEAMLHCKGTINPASIKKHIQATNQTFGAEDTLSDEVFYYNRKDKSFTVVR